MKVRMKTRHDFILPNVSDDFSHPQFEKVPEGLEGLTEKYARIIFGTDFTGLTKREDGLYDADLSACDRAKAMIETESNK